MRPAALKGGSSATVSPLVLEEQADRSPRACALLVVRTMLETGGV